MSLTKYISKACYIISRHMSGMSLDEILHLKSSQITWYLTNWQEEQEEKEKQMEESKNDKGGKKSLDSFAST